MISALGDLFSHQTLLHIHIRYFSFKDSLPQHNAYFPVRPHVSRQISPEWPIVEISSTHDMQQDKNVHMFFYRYCFLSTHKHWPSFRHLPLKFGTKFPCKTKSNKGEESWFGVRSSPFVFCGELTFTSLLLFILLVACAGNTGVQNMNLAVYTFPSLQVDVGFSAFYKLKIFCNLHVEKLHVGHIDMA